MEGRFSHESLLRRVSSEIRNDWWTFHAIVPRLAKTPAGKYTILLLGAPVVFWR
jgi:hypothetical protein